MLGVSVPVFNSFPYLCFRSNFHLFSFYLPPLAILFWSFSFLLNSILLCFPLFSSILSHLLCLICFIFFHLPITTLCFSSIIFLYLVPFIPRHCRKWNCLVDARWRSSKGRSPYKWQTLSSFKSDIALRHSNVSNLLNYVVRKYFILLSFKVLYSSSYS